GGTLSIECKLSGKSSHPYNVFWLRQYPGQKLEFFIRYNTEADKYIVSGFEARFLPSKNISTNVYYLKIKDLRVEDSATYYCTHYALSGTGTAVQVLPDNVLPRVFALYPLCNEPPAQHTLTIGCLVLTPDLQSLEIQWNLGASANVKYAAVFDSKRKHYLVASEVTIPVADWNSGKEYYCDVGKMGTAARIRKNIQKKVCF
uniref:Ig-like domain-containing protein n=1 Tax=Latimeria chalumnae TaxID=7897 RepID=H3A6H9_LATCH